MVKFRGSKKNKKHLEEAKKQRRNAVIAVSIGLLFVMSIFGIALQSLDGSQPLTVGSFTFSTRTNDDGYQYFEITKAKDKELKGEEFYYLPNDSYKSIFDPSSDTIYNLIKNTTYLYVSLDPILLYGEEEEVYALQVHDLSRSFLLETLNLKKILAFSSVETPYESSLEFGCVNATESNVVINYIDISRTNRSEGIRVNADNDNCIQIISSAQNMIRYNDLLRFLIISENE